MQFVRRLVGSRFGLTVLLAFIFGLVIVGITASDISAQAPGARFT